MKQEPLTQYNIQVLGAEDTYGPHADPYIAEVSDLCGSSNTSAVVLLVMSSLRGLDTIIEPKIPMTDETV